MATKIGDEKNYLPPITPEKKILGRYEIKRNIGQGGQGFVYLAHDPVLDVDVIIKGLRYDDTDSRKKFEKEVKTLRALHSTNIVRTYDFFTDGKSEYIGMEYVEGMDLDKLIDNQKGIPIPLAMHIFRQVCQGLYDAHRKDIIHRDIKPQNVLISKDGDVLLGDFGLAGREEDFTKEAYVYGTPHFMAPEQLDGRKIKGDKKSDIYSMGVMLYTMLIGEPTFLGKTTEDLMANIKKGEYTKPADRDPDIPAAVNELIVNMLEKDREKRPDIEGVIASVEEYERSLTSGIRAILDDALKISITSREKLDYHSLKLQNGFVTDLCSPASLYTKSCSVQLTVNAPENSPENSIAPFSPLYALIFKREVNGSLSLQGTIALSNSLKKTEYQSEVQVFEQGEYLVRVDFGSSTYLREFSLQRGQKQHLSFVCISYKPTSHLGLQAFDGESGENITDQTIFERQGRNDCCWEKIKDYAFVNKRLRAFCRGYVCKELDLPLETGCFPEHIDISVSLFKERYVRETDSGAKAFVITDGVLKKYRGSASSVTIPDGVTEIASEAFRGCSSLSAVTIPKGVTEIGEKAFQNCNIREVSHSCLTIQGGLAIKWNTPKDGKLLYCASQEANITIPDAITDIGDGAFSGCTSLVSVCIPNTVTAIGNGAFNGCTSLVSVTIPDRIKIICEKAFAGCTSLMSVSIPEGVDTIGESSFSACESLASVRIPDSVKTICREAFSDCTSLASVSIPDSVEKIGYHAFEDCTSLSSVTIPGSVKEIGDEAFEGCTLLTSVTIPGSVKEIGDEVFGGCTSLATVTVLDDVTKISSKMFANCTSLASVTIPGSVTEIGEQAFKNCNIRGISHPCLTIHDGLAIKDGWLLYCAGQAVDITIPEDVKGIGRYAFVGCTSLTSVIIPGSVQEISNHAFAGCSSLASVTISEGVKGISWYAFEGCTSLTSVTIPGSVQEISNNAFDGCTSLTSVTIAEGVEEIGGGAFWGCMSLTSVTIPKSVKEIGGLAFGGCNISELSHPCLVIHGGLAIKDGRLLYCVGQAVDITIPEDVKEIDVDAFAGCTSLTAVTIAEGVKEIGWQAFEGCTSLTSVTIPGSVKEISYHAFEGCTSLASVTISEGVKKIGVCTFDSCTSLASVTIPGSVQEIGWQAFGGCTSLAEIHFGGMKAQWAAVKKDEGWNMDVPAKSVICTDGEVEL